MKDTVSRFYVTYIGPLASIADGPKSRTFVKGAEEQVTHQEYAYFATRTKSWAVRELETEAAGGADAEIAGEEKLEASASGWQPGDPSES